MHAHGVTGCFVQVQGEVIEAHHLMKPADQLMEQRGQIAVRDDRFRNGQQGLVLMVRGRRLWVYWSACHDENRRSSHFQNQSSDQPYKMAFEEPA
jgi:hypothetical protein